MPVTVDQFAERFCIEHIDEIIHLDRVRERASLLSDFTLDDFVRMDKRLLGHLRGLTLRNAVAWRCLKDRIGAHGRSPGLLFAAGIVALAGEDHQQCDEFQAWLDEGTPLYPLMEKVGRWIAPSRIRTPDPTLACLNPDLVSVWRLITVTTSAEADAVVSATPTQSAPDVLVAVASVIRKFDLRRFEADIMRLTEHPDLTVKAAALMVLLRFNGPKALDLLWARSWEDLDCPALFYRAMSIVPVSDVLLWVERLENLGRKREALVCIAFAGQASMLPHLLDRAKDPQLSMLAMLCHIAIMGYASDGIFALLSEASGHAPGEFPPIDQPEAFFFNAADHRYGAGEPDSALCEARPGERIVAGREMTTPHAGALLRSGIQLQRVIASYWLDNHDPAARVDTSTPGFRQLRDLSRIQFSGRAELDGRRDLD